MQKSDAFECAQCGEQRIPDLAKLDSVVELKYGSDGIRADSNVSDLSALAQMKSLKMLWITGSEVDLTQLAELTCGS